MFWLGAAGGKGVVQRGGVTELVESSQIGPAGSCLLQLSACRHATKDCLDPEPGYISSCSQSDGTALPAIIIAGHTAAATGRNDFNFSNSQIKSLQKI